MAQIIDFIERKKLIESKNPTFSDKKTETPCLSFKIIAEGNNQNSERIRKDREQANNKVMKSYRIK